MMRHWFNLSPRRRVAFFSLVFLLLTSSLTACQRGPTRSPQLDPDIPTRTVEHALGESEIPVDPERVVLLSPAFDLDNLLSLGVKPVGTALFANRTYQVPPYLEDQAEDIEGVGTLVQPDLEKILLLDPDLIIATEFHRRIYRRLNQIAPTVAIQSRPESVREKLMGVANFVNRTEEAEILLDRYQERLSDFQEAMGERLEETEVSLVRVRQDGIFLYAECSPAGIILNDAGLQRPESQEGCPLRGPRVKISLENIDQADADVIFIWGEFEGDERAREQLKISPLWDQLEAVQNDQVYTVPESYWFFPGAEGIDLLIDDLFKYLVEETPEISQ